ncbi:MAG: hypothetical protein WAM14_17980 [Candidatus Nitrosopolaris sp.]
MSRMSDLITHPTIKEGDLILIAFENISIKLLKADIKYQWAKLCYYMAVYLKHNTTNDDLENQIERLKSRCIDPVYSTRLIKQC